jgi:hypothetical protein
MRKPVTTVILNRAIRMAVNPKMQSPMLTFISHEIVFKIQNKLIYAFVF